MTNKNKKPGRVRRQKLHVVDSPKRETKQRDFWSLFPNVQHHKMNDVMRKGNYLDDFIKIVEDLSEESFTRLESAELDLSKVIRDLKLDQYDEEIKYLLELITLSKRGTPVPPNRDFKDFQSRITLGEGTKTLMEREWVLKRKLADLNPGDLPPSEEDANESAKPGLPEIDNTFSEALRVLTDSIESTEKVSSPRPSLHNIFESDANAERRKIQETYSVYATVEQPVAEVVDTSPSEEKIVTYLSQQKPQFIVDVETAQVLLNRFDEEYSKRQINVIVSKKQVKDEKQNFVQNHCNDSVPLTLFIQGHLKAQREFDMIKKIWSQAREAFKTAKIEEVDPVALANEIQKLARFDVNHIFDDMYPSVELYEKEMARRGNLKRAVEPWPFEEKQKSHRE